jgi:hypothetical protein
LISPKPHHVAKATQFKDAIDDWQYLDNNDYFTLQEFVLWYGTAAKLKSDIWLNDNLQLSMEMMLCSEVDSDLTSIPKHQCRSITTLCCIIKQMVVRNQEARDALKNYFKNFDITKFLGKNVPMACLHLKAVAQALGENDLPTNVVRTVLKGFAKSSTKSFNDFCASQIALGLGSFYQTLMKNTSLQQQLNDVLSDLDTFYLDFVGGKLWAGVTSPPQESAFHTGANDKDEIRNAQAMSAMKNIPWEEWVKLYAKCHHCGKNHIRPHCPKYLQQIKSGEIKHLAKHVCPSPCGLPIACPPNNCAVPWRNLLKDPKAKEFLSAFQALFTNDDINGSNNDEGKSNLDLEGSSVDQTDQDAEDDVHAFLSLDGSLIY